MPEWSSWCWSSNSFFLLFLFYHWFHKWPSQLPTTSVTQAIKLILIRYFCYLVSRLWRREIRIAQRLLSISISKVYEKKKRIIKKDQERIGWHLKHLIAYQEFQKSRRNRISPSDPDRASSYLWWHWSKHGHYVNVEFPLELFLFLEETTPVLFTRD